MGQVVKPKDRLTVEERKLIPARAVVRVRVPLGLGQESAIAIVYDTGTPEPEGYNPHIVIVEKSHVSAKFDLVKLDEYAQGALLVHGNALSVSDSMPGFVAAFQVGGDGSAYMFVVILKSESGWQLAFHRMTTQARLTVSPDAKTLTLLYAIDPGGNDCVYCPHQYRKETLSLDEKTGAYKTSRNILLRQRLDPSQVVTQVLVGPR